MVSKNEHFSIQNYYDMYKARGLRLVVEYFFYNHLFDILNRTDTHSWNKANTINKDHGIYMASWSRDVKRAMIFLEKKNKDFVNKADLVDIGSGKGKVLLLWRKLYGCKKIIVGIENNRKLSDICINNFSIMNEEFPILIKKNAEEVMLTKENLIIKKNHNKIFFLYNPFGSKTLKTFFQKNSFKYSAIIYFNPLHTKELVNINYEIFSKSISNPFLMR